MTELGTPQKSALFLSAFFDELMRYGVHSVVVSPGSRSTPLAMVADASDLNVYVDVDERGAAFFALGLAKVSQHPVCLICTSGTATGNYLPAILEAKASRVPLIVLTADRPPRLQGLGAPQTCDQIKMFGDAVRCFHQMPLPSAEPRDLAFARQMGKEAYIQATGFPGAVHFNFPFEEPLKPDLTVEDLFTAGRNSTATRYPYPIEGAAVGREQIEDLLDFMRGKRGIVLCSEGSFSDDAEAACLLAWADLLKLPLIADPLSGLRQFDAPCVIDAYGGIFGSDDCPEIDYVIRFGQYPVSKRCFTSIDAMRPVQIVVDPFETRDFNYATDWFIRNTPASFVHAMLGAREAMQHDAVQNDYFDAWIKLNEQAQKRAAKVTQLEEGFEGAFVYRILGLAPEDSLIFSGNSMAIRMIDAFYRKSNKTLTCVCNRGLNGIDGTNSSAFGAAQCFKQTTYFTGDLTFLHDINALALQREILTRGEGHRAGCCTNGHSNGLVPVSVIPRPVSFPPPSIIVVLFNNNGGGIFDMLPQKSDEPYYERLFTTPQNVDFGQICHGFGVSHQKTDNAEQAAMMYEELLGSPGISVLEITVPLDGLKQRFDQFL